MKKLSEHELLIREGQKIVQALGSMFAPLVEVVLHDLRSPEHAIVAIANNLSGRQVGDPVTGLGLARIADAGFPDVVQNYESHFPDGRSAKSTSIGLKDSQGQFVAAICLNMELSLLQGVVGTLSQLAQMKALQPIAGEILESDGLNGLRGYVMQFATSHNTTPRGLSGDLRRELLKELDRKGLMALRNAPREVARILGVARSTIYSYR